MSLQPSGRSSLSLSCPRKQLLSNASCHMHQTAWAWLHASAHLPSIPHPPPAARGSAQRPLQCEPVPGRHCPQSWRPAEQTFYCFQTSENLSGQALSRILVPWRAGRYVHGQPEQPACSRDGPRQQHPQKTRGSCSRPAPSTARRSREPAVPSPHCKASTHLVLQQGDEDGRRTGGRVGVLAGQAPAHVGSCGHGHALHTRLRRMEVGQAAGQDEKAVLNERWNKCSRCATWAAGLVGHLAPGLT